MLCPYPGAPHAEQAERAVLSRKGSRPVKRKASLADLHRPVGTLHEVDATLFVPFPLVTQASFFRVHGSLSGFHSEPTLYPIMQFPQMGRADWDGPVANWVAPALSGVKRPAWNVPDTPVLQAHAGASR